MKEFHGNELSKQVLEVIKPFTCFPEILLETQTKKLGKNLMQLQESDIPQLAQAIEHAVAAFGSPDKGIAAKLRLLEVVKK